MKAMVIVAVIGVDVSIGMSHSLLTLYNNYTFSNWQSFSKQNVYEALYHHQYILVSNFHLLLDMLLCMYGH